MKRNINTKRLRRQLAPPRPPLWQRPWVWIVGFVVLVLLAVLVYQIPSVNNRAYFHLARIKARIHYFFNPPDKQVFKPSDQNVLSDEAIANLTAMAPTATPMPAETSVPLALIENTPTPTIVPTNTPVPTPLPKKVLLEGIEPEKQGFNNCGPSNLSMALGFWGGWEGDQYVTEKCLSLSGRTQCDAL